MAATPSRNVWSFGECELDEGLFELRRGGSRVPIEPKVWAEVSALAEELGVAIPA